MASDRTLRDHPDDAPADLEDYGKVTVSTQGQITIPKSAREALGLDQGRSVYVFGSKSLGRAWIVATDRSPAEIAEFLSATSVAE